MLTSRNARQAQSLLAELTSAHNINAQVIALVELFKAAWQQPTFHQAAAHLQRFAALAMRSGIKAVQRFAKRIARDADYIAHAIELKLTNGAIGD